MWASVYTLFLIPVNVRSGPMYEDLGGRNNRFKDPETAKCLAR